MRVEKIMTRDPLTCTPDEHAGTAAWRMWNGDCGILPVVRDGRLVGVLTDRDIAVALALRGGRAQDLRIAEIQQGGEALVACGPPDSVSDALALMREHRVRRLPVVEEGRLVGIVSMNDLVLGAAPTAGKTGRPTFKEVMHSLQGICAHRPRPQ